MRNVRIVYVAVGVLGIGVLGPHVLKAQNAGTGIRLVNSHQISVDNATHPHAETFIAVDSKDPQHLLATSNVIVNGRALAYPYSSFDGGRTWTRGRIIGDTTVVTGGDPVVYISPAGSAFFVTLARLRGRAVTIISRSTDGGESQI